MPTEHPKNTGRSFADHHHREAVAEPEQNAWLLLAFGDHRSYAGNVGYADQHRSVYKYDSFVQNHTKVQAGDIALLRDRTGLLGVARIARIEQAKGKKTQRRCPRCNSTALKTRRIKRPPLFCSVCKLEFVDPIAHEVACDTFEAFFDDTFVPTPAAVPVQDLRAACPNYSGQLAMQPIALKPLLPRLMRANPSVEQILGGLGSITLVPEDAEQDRFPYAREKVDEREQILRTIRARRGQRSFRDAVRARYDDRCVVTGCKLVDILEAAHISPYRGPKDHHAANGLLLRADIHTLFDLDLLGIEPGTLLIYLHPKAHTAYDGLHGTHLIVSGRHTPSEDALRFRWKQFQTRLAE